MYSFITANYTPGDEIVLIGFSRGAFTARSVAGIINDIGLLTRGGMNDFYPIFKDQENFKNDRCVKERSRPSMPILFQGMLGASAISLLHSYQVQLLIAPRYHDIFPTIPFPDKPRGPDAQIEYKRRLEKVNLVH